MNEILATAHRLGTLIGSHPAVASYRELTRQLDLDISARSLLGQFEQLMEMLAQKEANMQPIEIAEKQQMQTLQQSIQMHPLIKKLSLAERDYRLVMQKVQETINGGLTGQAAPAEAAGAGEVAAAPSKIILE